LGKKATAIAAGGNIYGVGGSIAGPGHGLAATSSGAVYAWGYNADGELGNGSIKNSTLPVKVKLPGGRKATAVAAGAIQSLAKTSSGTVYAWGGNNFGQLGDGSYTPSSVPVKVRVP
jgi:alpha-tubulin suppressor-like RCC1 family protein